MNWVSALIQRLQAQRAGRIARLVEVQSFGVHTKLAVVEFSGKTLLLSVSRDGVSLIATAKSL